MLIVSVYTSFSLYCFLVATTTPHQSSHQDLQAKAHKYLSHDTPLILMITIVTTKYLCATVSMLVTQTLLSLKVVQVGVKKV